MAAPRALLRTIRRSLAQRVRLALGVAAGVLGLLAAVACESEDAPETAVVSGAFRPLAADEWNAVYAAHLLERAGFGGTPREIARFAAMTPERAVEWMLRADPGDLAPFDHSGVHDAGLEPFPPSRPATTKLARETGEALGVKVKPDGNRPLQPVVNRFFYWLRASRLETHRLAYWWADRMLNSEWPLQEKIALFWHGHFAVNETKTRDYRKMLRQLEIFHKHGTGNFRTLLVEVSRDPAMLAFLDAGNNVKGAPNENFAREIMELFTMGVGNYSEQDIREAARAFTGWNFVDLDFVVDPEEHDAGTKTVLGKTGNFDGVEVIDIILAESATADFIAAKLYRYFVRDEIDAERRAALGALLREGGYEIEHFLRTLFRSRDFYSEASLHTQIKSPVQLAIGTYRKLGLRAVPGVPDFNDVTAELGQQLFRPPTVAGWAYGRSWMTPGLLMARGNFGYDVLFPDINFVAPDRVPQGFQVALVNDKIAQGYDISAATKPEGMSDGDGMTAMANLMADRDEDFNTRYGSFKGWQMAIAKVKPIPRTLAAVDLSGMLRGAQITTPEGAVDYLLARFLSAPADPELRLLLIAYLEQELGTDDFGHAEGYLEEPLRRVLHLILSTPAYQLG
jgi:hypothetical protein